MGLHFVVVFIVYSVALCVFFISFFLLVIHYLFILCTTCKIAIEYMYIE